ncbi:MAG: EAL domain-containing protein [Myxococcales bacterium]|nr:EAL domain-containing protein [Myxococcales bacterium]
MLKWLPRRQAPAASAPDTSPEALGDRALDALGGVLRVFGEVSFDVEGLTGDDLKRRCGGWITHLLVGGDHPEGDGAAERSGRDFRGAGRFFGEQRRREVDLVRRLRRLVGSTAARVAELVAKDEEGDERIRGCLARLKQEAEEGSIESLRERVDETVSVAEDVFGERKRRHAAEIERLAERLDSLNTALKEARREASTDPLTQVFNRASLDRHMQAVVELAAFTDGAVCLLMVDIDHFKRINDSHGHAAGDALLCELTRRLREALRIEDTLARMGGDELMVLLPDVGASATEAEAAAREVARKLRATLEVPVQVGALEYRVGASIGITVFPREDSPTVEDLIREADTAMYVAKQAERGSVRLYESTMREHVASRVALERALRLAIEQDQIRLHLQGQWTADGQMAGIEALARWQDPELGAVSPVDFIPVAEESGLILPLGRRVVEQACATARRLHDEGILVPLSVNVSPRQFTDPGFVAHLLQSVRDQGIAPSDLQLELTEGILADDASERLMNRLADEGFRFSIDDFGTGWSNLMYLKRLPVHELKIDRAFVRDVVDDADDAALVQAIIGIASRFGIQTVAEGVETPAQARFLLDAGCDRLQGWLFDRARPLADLLAAPRSQPAVA